MIKKLVSMLLLLFAPVAMAGQGMYVRINSYLPNTAVKILSSDCVDHVRDIKVNKTAYIEAGFCFDNELTLSLQQQGKELMRYNIRVSFSGSSLSPKGVRYLGDKVIAATLYPHAGLTGTQDWVVISLAYAESNWMKEKANVLANKPLNTVILPGSHDSGTQGINVQSEMTSDMDPKIRDWIDLDPLKMQHLTNWSISQKQTISDQLNTGIRYLDLRLCKTKRGKLVTCHGLAGTSMDAILKTVGLFVASHEKEIIILDINHVYDLKPSDINRLGELVQQHLGGVIASPTQFSPMSPVQDFWSHHKQVIVLINNAYAEKTWSFLFWRSNLINSPWPNKQNLQDMEKSLHEILFKSRHHGINKLFVLQTQETPSAKTIIDGFNPFESNPDSLLKLTTQYKFGIENWLRDVNNQAQIKLNGNIIMEDFTNGIDLTEYAKRVN